MILEKERGPLQESLPFPKITFRNGKARHPVSSFSVWNRMVSGKKFVPGVPSPNPNQSPVYVHSLYQSSTTSLASESLGRWLDIPAFRSPLLKPCVIILFDLGISHPAHSNPSALTKITGHYRPRRHQHCPAWLRDCLRRRQRRYYSPFRQQQQHSRLVGHGRNQERTRKLDRHQEHGGLSASDWIRHLYAGKRIWFRVPLSRYV
jgi:hypothetical protein